MCWKRYLAMCSGHDNVHAGATVGQQHGPHRAPQRVAAPRRVPGVPTTPQPTLHVATARPVVTEADSATPRQLDPVRRRGRLMHGGVLLSDSPLFGHELGGPHLADDRVLHTSPPRRTGVPPAVPQRVTVPFIPPPWQLPSTGGWGRPLVFGTVNAPQAVEPAPPTVDGIFGGGAPCQ